MALTRPSAAQIATGTVNLTDAIIRINSGETGANTSDVGIIFERGSHTNAGLIWDESSDAFRFISTTNAGEATTDINISAHHNLHVGTLAASSISLNGTAVTSTAAELNILDGVTATATEINYLSGVTSAIQTQIDNISSSFTLAADSGVSDTFTTGQTLTFTGGTGIDTTVSDNTITYAIDSTVATLTGSQTLTNKTLTSPTITNPVISSISNTGTLTLPTSTDTLVGRATTDTLTNKTLTSAQVTTDIRLNAQAELEFYDSDSSHYVSFRAPATVASSVTWTLPASDGTADQVLATNGAGTLSWADAGAGGGSGSSYPNSTFQTVPGTDGNFDLSYNVAQTTQETPFEASGTDAFGVNLGSVFDSMDPVGTLESIDYGSGEAYVGA